MEQKLELLVGDKYALKDNSLILLLGDSGCTSLQSVMANSYTKKQAEAEGKALVERLNKNIEKEAGYQSIFGIVNLEAALRQAITEEKQLEHYNIFLYKLPAGEDLQKGFGTMMLAEEVTKEYREIHERYLICKESYDRMDGHEKKKELQQKMRLLGEMACEGKDTAGMEYIVTYLSKKIGSEYEKIVIDTIDIAGKTSQLSKLGVEVGQARGMLLSWSQDLLNATSLSNTEEAARLSQAIDRNKRKIDEMLERKQKEKSRQD